MIGEPLLVPRSVRRGGWLLLGGTVQLLVAMGLVQVGYPNYSWIDNVISDLGNTQLSPWWPLFSASSVVLGACVIVGAAEMRSAFRPGPARTVGLALLILAGIGAIGVGLNPEDLRPRLHVASAGLAFIGGNTALIVLALAMRRLHHWNGYRIFSVVLGVVGLVSLGIYELGLEGALGHGGTERLIAFPLWVWAIVVGIHLVRLPTVAPPGHTPHPIPAG